MIYYELTQHISPEKALDLIAESSLENMEKEISYLRKFRGELVPSVRKTADKTISDAQTILNRVHKE